MALHPSTAKGLSAELAVASKLLEAGFEVAFPYGAHPFDLLARCPRSRRNPWLRIQVKLASPRARRKAFHADLRHPGKKRAAYGPEEVDFFICWRLATAEFWVIRPSESLRVTLDEQTPGFGDVEELRRRRNVQKSVRKRAKGLARP